MSLEEIMNQYAAKKNYIDYEDLIYVTIRENDKSMATDILLEHQQNVTILVEKELLKRVAKVAKTKKEIVQSSEIVTNEYATKNDILKVPMRVENKAEIKIVVDKESINNDNNLII